MPPATAMTPLGGITPTLDSRTLGDALMPQLLDELVGRAQSGCLSQRREHDLLLGVQRFGCSATVGHGILWRP